MEYILSLRKHTKAHYFTVPLKRAINYMVDSGFVTFASCVPDT